MPVRERVLAGLELLGSPEIGVGRLEVAHLLVSHAAGENRQRLTARATVDPALQQRQRGAAVAPAQTKEALVEPGIGQALIDPKRRVEIGVGNCVLAAGHFEDSAIDQCCGAIASCERLLGQGPSTAGDALITSVARKRGFVAILGERAADRENGGAR